MEMDSGKVQQGVYKRVYVIVFLYMCSNNMLVYMYIPAGCVVSDGARCDR